MANDQDFALSHTALQDHVTEQPSVNDRRLVSENGDVTMRRNGASKGQLDDRVYHIADGHTTVRPHLEVIVWHPVRFRIKSVIYASRAVCWKATDEEKL